VGLRGLAQAVTRRLLGDLVRIVSLIIIALVLAYACTDDPTPDTHFNDYCCEPAPE